MDKEQLKKEALEYHSDGTPGKIALKMTKPLTNQHHLSLAYTPGVAEPCKLIAENKEDVYKYTAKGNSVAVVSDGTAVLGLGDIGPSAGIPVMEGKGVLFKGFGGVDAFPLCLDDVRNEKGRTDPDKIVETVKRIAPCFGGINLEDIGAPACFEIEERLIKELDIPVFHDDQHGTAIITFAALLNAVEMTGKKMEDLKVVFNGAGAAGIACAKLYISAGIKKENMLMCDSKGVIYKGRTEGMNPQKEFFAADTEKRTLADAMKGADLFCGVSVAGCLKKEMVSSMNEKSIIFAMANPVPEIMPEEAYEAGGYVVGTGRSDFPNQVNNVLGFPGIFRGALDVGATAINDEMKIGAAQALAGLAKEPVPQAVKDAYKADADAGILDGDNPINSKYVIPKPIDARVVPRVARYVAEAAMKSGVAKKPIDDLDSYEQEVTARIKKQNEEN
ncbi:malic enzyme-like NAD(P)-binding protein [Nanoarchaeota archaeon]